jgi:diguanylate cyclase
VRYHESGEQSAELLRLVLPHMARHGGVHHPTHYAVWYEYLAALNLPLKSAMEERLAQPEPMCSADVVELYRRHLATRDAEYAERMQQRLHAVLRHLGQVADSAGHEAEDFSHSLAAAVDRLTDELDAEGLGELIRDLAVHTASVRASAEEMRVQIAASTREIADLKEQLEQIQTEALTDPLTRLRNRRGFERASARLLDGRPTALAGCSVLMADIDHFKRINDTYRHLLGDQVLKGVAHILGEVLKRTDLAARFGGEEFAILLPDTALGDALHVAERIRLAVSRARIQRSGQSEYIDQITISLGAACAVSGENLEQLVERADRALYRAKQSGRNRVESLSQAA